jgi:autotransporter-associated beta strand protein
VAGGTLNVGNNSALGTGTLIVNSGTVNFTASGPSVSSLSGTGGNIVLSNTTLSVGSDNTTRFAGTLSQAASTTGGLIKVGSGALSLSGSNTYKGNTLINAGTLLAVNSAGSATGSGSVIVASNAILGGSGLIVPSAGNSVTIQSGGILSPHVTANGYSKLTVTGALNLNAGSILNFNFGSAGNDEVVANSIAFGGNSETLNVAFPNGVAAGVYPILKASSFSGQASPVFTVNGTTADAYTILAPGAPGNTFTNAYALQAVAQTTTWTGASSGNWDTNEANWNGPAGTMYSDGEPVVFDNTPLQYSSQFTVSVQSTVTPASVIFNNSIGNNYTITTPYNIGTVISGSCGVYINGTGTVTFGAVTYEGNSYTGGTFLNAGVLNINDDDKLGTVPAANAVNLVFNGGTLQAGIADLQISGTRTIQLNAGGGTLDTNANEMEIEGNLIQGSGGLTVIGGGTLKFHDGYYNNPVGNLDQNTYSGGTVVNGATIEVVETDSSSVPAYPAAGPITSGLFGTGAVSLNNGSALLEDNYKETYYANAFNLSGALTIQPPTNGLFFTATAGNVTTLTGNTTLNLLNAHVYGNENPVYLNLLAPVVGAHSIAVNGLDTSAVYTGVVFGSAANTFSGGLSVTNAEIQVGDALSSTVSGGVVTSGPLGTGLVTLHANSVLFGLDDGTDTDVVSNSFLIDGNTTLISGHGHFWIDSNGSTGSTFTLANTPTITNSTGYGKMYIRNYVLQGTGFTLLDNHTSSGGGNPLIIYSPGLSQTGMTTSVTLDSSSLVYDVNTLSSPASFEFGQQAINISGGSFTFNTATSGYGQTGTLTNAINVDSNGGTLAGDNTVASSVFSGPVNTIGTLNVSEAVLTGAITGGGTVALEGDNNNNNANSGVILRSAATVTNDFTVTGPPPFTPYNISIGSSDNGSGGVSSTFSGTVAIASSGNVNLTAAAGGTLKFTNIISGSGASITKVGSGTVILSGSNTYSGTTNLSSGTLQFAREVALYGDNTAVWASNLNVSSNSGATLAVNVGGPGEFTSSDLDILQTTLKGGTNLGFDTTNAAGGNFTYGSTITDAPGTYQHVGVVKLGPNSLTLTASNTYSGGTTIQGGVLVASSGLAGVGIGTITVNGGGAIFRNTSAGTVNNLLQGGYNSGGWNGPYGIVSNTAASDPKYLHAVGELQPSTPTTFQGQPLGTGDVAIKYTYYGDSNLDGKVDGTDYSRIDNGYLQGLSGWQNGDFNYDGVINGSDYTLIDNAYNTQGAQISAETASATAQIAGVSGSSAVPEPATLGLLGIAAVGLLGRPRLGKRRR